MTELAVSLRRSGVNAFRRIRRRPRARFTAIVLVRARNGLPERLNPRRIYQLGAPAKWAAFECPCGRGHILELNLAHPGRARWRLSADPSGAPSLSPSVDSKGSRRCHFWLREGRVRWV